MTIGERIKQRRQELGLTQEELAKRLGNKTRASVCTVEKDKEDLTTARIRQYAEALETTPSYLVGWEVNTGANVETEPGMAYTLAPLPSDISKEDQELLARYHNASPEDRAIVDLALKRSQQKS